MLDLAPHQSPYLRVIEAIGVDGMKDFVSGLSDMEALMFKYDYEFYSRPAQRMPTGAWDTWVVLGGRGLGKTWTGAKTVIQWAEELGPGGHIALVAKDPSDARDVMVEGRESGILAMSPPWFRPRYEPSKRLLEWPNGCIAHTYSSEVPDDLRGPQHHKAWGDEPCKWKYAQRTWDNLELGLRLGDNPQSLLTTTPRPVKFLVELLDEKGTVVTTGSTYENKVNLSDKFLTKILRKYEGTRLGQQEIHAKMLLDTPGALWTLDRIEALRVRPDKGQIAPVPLVHVAIGIDPPGTGPKDVMSTVEGDDDEGTECGLVVAGRGEDGHLYVLHDLSAVLSPHGWGMRAVSHYQTLKLDVIVAERNYGGDMVLHNVLVAAKELGVEVNVKTVTASRGKHIRAQPISALYEQGRAHHVGMFAELEDELTTWVPGMKSPNRLDALVWAATDVMLEAEDDWEIH